MIVPALCIVLGTLFVVCDAGAAETLAAVKAARAKALHGAAAPDVFAKKAGATALTVSPETTYVSSGWLVQTVYSDATCGTPGYSDGYTVDTCYIANGLGFKYQLTRNSCSGAVRQDFSDNSCITLSTTTALDDLYTDGCVLSGGYSLKGVCTTSSTPPVPYHAMMETYYREAGCDSAASMSAIPADECMGTFKFNCIGDTVDLLEYSDANCEGTSTTYAYPSTCMADNDDMTELYYGPGDHSTSFTMTCNNGASGLFSTSMSVKAVAALVLGVMAFLAV